MERDINRSLSRSSQQHPKASDVIRQDEVEELLQVYLEYCRCVHGFICILMLASCLSKTGKNTLRLPACMSLSDSASPGKNIASCVGCHVTLRRYLEFKKHLRLLCVKETEGVLPLGAFSFRHMQLWQLLLLRRPFRLALHSLLSRHGHPGPHTRVSRAAPTAGRGPHLRAVEADEGTSLADARGQQGLDNEPFVCRLFLFSASQVPVGGRWRRFLKRSRIPLRVPARLFSP